MDTKWTKETVLAVYETLTDAEMKVAFETLTEDVMQATFATMSEAEKERLIYLLWVRNRVWSWHLKMAGRFKVLDVIEPWMHLIKQVEVEVQKVEKEVRITIHPEDDAEREGLDEIFDEVSKVIGKELTLPAEGALSNLVGEVIRPWRKEIHEVIWAKDLSSVEIRFEPGVSKVRKEAITKWCGPALKRALKQAA